MTNDPVSACMRRVYAEAKAKPGFKPKGALWVLTRETFADFQRETGVYAAFPKICVTFCDIPIAELARGKAAAPVMLVPAYLHHAESGTPIN